MYPDGETDPEAFIRSSTILSLGLSTSKPVKGQVDVATEYEWQGAAVVDNGRGSFIDDGELGRVVDRWQYSDYDVYGVGFVKPALFLIVDYDEPEVESILFFRSTLLRVMFQVNGIPTGALCGSVGKVWLDVRVADGKVSARRAEYQIVIVHQIFANDVKDNASVILLVTATSFVYGWRKIIINGRACIARQMTLSCTPLVADWAHCICLVFHLHGHLECISFGEIVDVAIGIPLQFAVSNAVKITDGVESRARGAQEKSIGEHGDHERIAIRVESLHMAMQPGPPLGGLH